MKRRRPRRSVVAIDGPAGSGKSTAARAIARSLSVPYIDTGAMYRALTWLAMKRGIVWSDVRRLISLARSSRIRIENLSGGAQRIRINGLDATHEIRSPAVTRHVHYVASRAGVRKQMVLLQRRLGEGSGGVLEGRDIGTVVFPRAYYKFYLDAKPSVRARRRFLELRAKGIPVSLVQTARELRTRDRRDRTRMHGRLKRAKDAVYLDTSELSVREVIRLILEKIRGVKGKRSLTIGRSR